MAYHHGGVRLAQKNPSAEIGECRQWLVGKNRGNGGGENFNWGPFFGQEETIDGERNFPRKKIDSVDKSIGKGGENGPIRAS